MEHAESLEEILSRAGHKPDRWTGSAAYWNYTRSQRLGDKATLAIYRPRDPNRRRIRHGAIMPAYDDC